MSVAVGAAHRPGVLIWPALIDAKIRAGTAMPATAARIGRASRRGLASSPLSASYFSSSPTTKKNTAIRPCLIQSSTEAVSLKAPN